MSNFKMRSLDILVVIIINFKVCSLLDMNDTIGSTEKWGLCNAQCEVLCMESKENCECSGYSKNTVWMFRCSHNTTDCLVGSCSNFGFQEGYIPKVPNISTGRIKTDVILRWNMDSTSLHVIYIIQRRWTKQGDWETVGWSSNNTFTVNVGCRAPYTRIASVSKFGSRFFSNPVKVPDMYIGPVQNLTAASIKYDNKTDEIRIKFTWNPPRGWKHSQIRIYQWSSYPILKGCPDLNWQRHRVYFDSQILNAGFITARIPSYLKDCNLTLQVKADPHCTFQTNLLAEYANFSLNCTMVDNLACSPKPYNPPGNVHEVKVILIPTQTAPRARITWEPPTDLGSSDHIDRYWIAWGILDDKQPDNIFGLSQNLIDVKHIAVPGTQLFTEFYLPPNITNTTMGIQIMACGPGHVITENGWVSPIISIPRAAMDEYFKFKDQLLSDTDGFIVVKIPNHSSVRVYWRLNENHHQLKRYKFRWGKFVNYELKPENATDLDTNATYLDINQLQTNTTYGIEFVELWDENNDEVDTVWDNATVYLFTVPGQNGSSSGGTPPAIPTKSNSLIPNNNTSLIPNNNTPNWISLEIILPILVVIVVALIIVLFIRCKRKHKLENLIRNTTTDNSSFYYQLQHRTSINIITPSVVADKWELPYSCFKLDSVLGEGAFGQVRLGYITHSMLVHRDIPLPKPIENTLHVAVAIKLLQDGIDSRYKNEFLREINLMKELGRHQNIVSMIGCCTLRDPVCLVVEHVPNGDLLAYLKKVRHDLTNADNADASNYENTQKEILTSLDILSFSRQIAMGMEFLSEKGYVHRDLAARNVLVADNKLLKIGDFGLARYIYDDKIYVNRKGGKLPLKWMSVEAIFELLFSVASDVWSFGIVLFEIVTFGGTPYPTIANNDLLRELSQGYRMEKPENCSQQFQELVYYNPVGILNSVYYRTDKETYKLMLLCWNENPKNRPSFTQLRHTIEDMMEISSTVSYVQLTFNPHNNYYLSNEDNSQEASIDGAVGPLLNSHQDSVMPVSFPISISADQKDKLRSFPSTSAITYNDSLSNDCYGKVINDDMHNSKSTCEKADCLLRRRHRDSSPDDVFSEAIDFEIGTLNCDDKTLYSDNLLGFRENSTSSMSSYSSTCDLLLHPSRLVSVSSADSAFPNSPFLPGPSVLEGSEADHTRPLRHWYLEPPEKTNNLLARSKSLTLPRTRSDSSHEKIRTAATLDIEYALPRLRSKRISSDLSNSSKDSALSVSPNLNRDNSSYNHYNIEDDLADSTV